VGKFQQKWGKFLTFNSQIFNTSTGGKVFVGVSTVDVGKIDGEKFADPRKCENSTFSTAPTTNTKIIMLSYVMISAYKVVIMSFGVLKK
jgi:hypothetical protein